MFEHDKDFRTTRQKKVITVPPCNYANVGGASAYPIAGSGPFHNTVPESDLMHVSGLGSDSVL